MIFSTNFSGRIVLILLTVLICHLAFTAINGSATELMQDSPVPENNPLIAVLPVSNLSVTPAPLEDIRRSLTDDFKRQDFNVLPEEVLERFLAKHRIRYVGGITRTIARDLKWETGAESVLITSLELYSEVPPPKISLTSRLVSTGGDPTILWMDAVGIAGDDSIGILELSLVEDPKKLLRKALRRLSTSLAGYLAGERPRVEKQREIIKFWPRVFYRSPIMEPGRRYTVAVLPFFNLSERKFAGNIIGRHFVRQLRTLENFTVLEPGVIRDALLRMRIIMHDGISLADASALFSRLNADLILAGTVFDYQDYQGTTGRPVVDFSALLLEKKSLEVVWNCRSSNKGDDGVFFFDWGKINTAQALASEMVASTLDTIVE